MKPRYAGSITDVSGIQVGHAQDVEAGTGCTVILAGEGAIAGGSVRGLAPGTRETDLLRPGTLVQKANAILLTGGSAFGLAAADGVMHYLEEHGLGHDTGVAKVPIVPGAVLFDLAVGKADVRPDTAMGYQACQNASATTPAMGNVGAGTGASVGKLLGMNRACKGGIGTASVKAGSLVVGAIVATNAFGDIIDPENGLILAGARKAIGSGFADTAKTMRSTVVRNVLARTNTVIGVIATNADLDVGQINQVAAAAHDGLARVVRPSHTLFDGDTLFALGTGQVQTNLALVADMAAEATAKAIINGILAAEPAYGLPAVAKEAQTRLA